VDIFGFYEPGTIQDILAGKVWEFEISQAWALGALLLMMIPSLMVILSMILKAGVNRWINMIVAAVYIVVGIGTTIGETWAFYIVGHVVGIVLLLIVIWTAIRWPKKEV
jgi:ABC-type multidrug transport system permease subunit